MKKNLQNIKDDVLEEYKELFLEGEVSSVNEFHERRHEFLDLDKNQDFSYSTFYRWTKERDDIKDLKGEPVQTTKNHKRLEKEEVEKTEEAEEPENEGSEKEEDKELELEKRIEELDRIETENPESKEEIEKEETDIIEKTKSNFDFTKIAIAGGITLTGFLVVFLLNRKSKNKKEVVQPDVQTREEEKRSSAGGFAEFPSPADY